MLKLILQEKNDSIVSYFYYLNSEEEYGEIAYNFKNKEIIAVKLASYDKNGKYMYYAEKALKSAIESNDFKEELGFAWY